MSFDVLRSVGAISVVSPNVIDNNTYYRFEKYNDHLSQDLKNTMNTLFPFLIFKQLTAQKNSNIKFKKQIQARSIC